jgi:hypothetical protein
VFLVVALLPLVSLWSFSSSTISNQLVAGSIIVRHIKSILEPSLPLRVYGPIKSTHNVIGGSFNWTRGSKLSLFTSFLTSFSSIYDYFLYATRPNSLFGVGIAIATAAVPLFGILFLENLLELVQSLAQLRERLLRGIGILSAFLGSAETTIASIVGCVCAPMLLAQVAMFLGTYLFQDSEILSTRPLRTLLLAV